MANEFDIRKHVLVPKHEVLGKEEAREVLERYRVSPHQLQSIKSTDPVVKVIGAKVGDILKITRQSPTAGKSIAYRRVVKG